MRAPLLIGMPLGLVLGGVVTWALRLGAGLARRGRRVLIAAEGAPGETPTLPDGCEVRWVRGAAHEAYPGLVDELRSGHDGPVVVLPNLSAENYAAAARLTTRRPGAVRVAAWTHCDIPHDYRLAEHFEPMIGRFVGVSTRTAAMLRERLPARAMDVAHIPYGVESRAAPVAREALPGRPVRLLYAGRLEGFAKRAGALIHLVDALRDAGIEHELRIAGDGPELSRIIDAARSRRSMVMLGRLAPPALREEMELCDLFVLASRHEGLSVAMLEAMASGCVPVVTRVASGADDAITHGVNGVLVDSQGDEEAIGRRLALGVAEARRIGLERMSASALETARRTFGIGPHLSACERLIDALASEQARDWPTDGAASEARGFTVPDDAEARALETVSGLRGRVLALWGGGRHTRAVLPLLIERGARVVAVIDDDPEKHGSAIGGVPVVSSEGAKRLGASDVVISSALHEQDLWSKRGELEMIGLRVHRVYGAKGAA